MAYNVLIADDSASIRFIIEKALKLSGLEIGEVHSASDGYGALSVLAERWIDVVFADINMPNMGGIELIENMRHQGITGRVPVIVVSTEGRREVVEHLLQSGAAAFLRKPFAPEELGAVARSVLAAGGEAQDDRILEAAFFEALEGFAMLVGNRAESLGSPPATALMTTIRFVGPGAVGSIVMAASPMACDTIVRSATGSDGGDGLDALAELANTAAGQLVSRLSGGPFALQPPEGGARSGEQAWAEVAQCATRATFDIEGHEMAVGFIVGKRWR